jgi:AraC-like DNA-binding protein/mannose-6-phosphate isomerase-like protein (cupin superfamily)
MRFFRPEKLLAGFHVHQPDPNVPELHSGGEQWAAVNFVVEKHIHEGWEFYLQVDGASRWDGPDQTYEVRAGDFFAVGPGVQHQMHERSRDKHHFLYVAFDIEVVLERYAELDECWRGRDLVYVRHGETLLDPFRSLIREVSIDLPHRTAALRLALDALVIEATRLLEREQARDLIATEQSGKHGNGRPGSAIHSPYFTLHPAVARARELLEHQPSRNWKVADLARMCGLSAGHLAHLFTSEVGVSPRHYLLRVRIERAQGLLAHSDVGITQLALELGFSSSQHFAAAFKQFTGQSAKAYRTSTRGAATRGTATRGAATNGEDEFAAK